MCLKHEVRNFIAWSAFTFSLVNSIVAGAKVFWYGGYSDYWTNYVIWLAISFGFYIWHKLKC